MPVSFDKSKFSPNAFAKAVIVSDLQLKPEIQTALGISEQKKKGFLSNWLGDKYKDDAIIDYKSLETETRKAVQSVERTPEKTIQQTAAPAEKTPKTSILDVLQKPEYKAAAYLLQATQNTPSTQNATVVQKPTPARQQ